MEWLIKLLSEFGSDCYFYGERTGDYEMKDVFKEVFFRDLLFKITSETG